MSDGGPFGYGQQQPNDADTDLNVIAFVARRLLARLDTMKLVKIVAVHAGSGTPPAAGTVDVLPLVSQIDGNGYPVKHGTVYGLPFYRLGGATWQVICDPEVGDTGYVVCADRDSSLVVKNGGQQNPGSRRRYNIADGVYVGGVLNAAPKASIWLKSDGTFNITDKNNMSVESTTGGLNFGVGGTNVLALTSSAATFSVNVVAPDFQDPDASLPSYKTHTHNVTVPSTPFTGPTTAPNSGT